MAAHADTTTSRVDARKRAHSEARAAMAQWVDYRGHQPFIGLDGFDPADRASSFLSSAGAMLSCLAAAYEDAQTLVRAGNHSEIDSRSGSVIAGALEGIATLVDLAAFTIVD